MLPFFILKRILINRSVLIKLSKYEHFKREKKKFGFRASNNGVLFQVADLSKKVLHQHFMFT